MDSAQTKASGLAAEPVQPYSLAELVAYAPGAVVSRTLVKKEVGTVTLFAFDEGQGLSEHSAPFDALVQILEGEAEVRVEQERHTVRAGQVLLLPANRPHALDAGQRFKMLLTMIRSQ